MPDLRQVEARLARVLESATGLLPQTELRQMCELVSAGEPGVALENLCTQLYEHDVSVSPELASEVEAVAGAELEGGGGFVSTVSKSKSPLFLGNRWVRLCNFAFICTLP